MNNIPLILVPFPAPNTPQSFTVTNGKRNMTFSWFPPVPTLHNGVITGYSLSCVPEVGGRNTISKEYTAAGTFTLGGFTPATSYNCSISASNIWGNGPVACRVVSTQDDCKYSSWRRTYFRYKAVVHAFSQQYFAQVVQFCTYCYNLYYFQQCCFSCS